MALFSRVLGGRSTRSAPELRARAEFALFAADGFTLFVDRQARALLRQAVRLLKRAWQPYLDGRVTIDTAIVAMAASFPPSSEESSQKK